MNSVLTVRAPAIAFTLVALALPLEIRAQRTAPLPDSVVARAQRLYNDGDVTRGRALLDSVVRTSRDGSAARAQALYWRATLSTDSATAEGDFVAIIVDHALSPYTADALLRLGQIEYARGNRSGAINHFQLLVLEHRTSPAAADGWLLLGIARIANNDLPNACVALDSARRRIPSSNVEQLNRVTYVASPCRALAEARQAPQAVADTVVTPEPSIIKRWSAQVAAYNTNADAEKLVKSLKARGHTARIDKLPPRYHVRVGSFATRAEAVSLVSKLKREKINAIVVEAIRREP